MMSKLVDAVNLMSTWTYMNIRGQGYSLSLVLGHPRFTISNFFSLETARPIEAKFYVEPPWDGEWKFVQMVQVTSPIWPSCPYMVKTLKKSSSLEPNSRWPWKLVCSIGYSSTCTTKFIQMMTLGWHWSILLQGQIWSFMLLYGKKVT